MKQKYLCPKFYSKLNESLLLEMLFKTDTIPSVSVVNAIRCMLYMIVITIKAVTVVVMRHFYCYFSTSVFILQSFLIRNSFEITVPSKHSSFIEIFENLCWMQTLYCIPIQAKVNLLIKNILSNRYANQCHGNK